jgi:hypothetical protein
MVITNKPTIVGWLDIVAGIIGLLFVAFIILIVIGFAVGFGNYNEFSQARIWVIFIAFALPGILAIIGGISSIKRRNWTLVLIGSICAIPLGLGIIGVVLLVQSRKEFNHPVVKEKS